MGRQREELVRPASVTLEMNLISCAANLKSQHLPRMLGWASESLFRSQKPRTRAAGIAGISTALLHLKIYDGPEVIRKNRIVFDFRKLLFNVLVVFKALKLPLVYILHTLFLHCYSNGLNQGKQT